MGMAAPIATGRSATGIPTGKLAIWWVVGSEIVIFGGLLACYVMYRLKFDFWAESSAVTNTMAGAVNTLVLLTSSLFAVLAHNAAENKKGAQAAGYLLLTIGGGLTFLLIKAFEWGYEISHGYTITASTFWSFYYTAAGIHAAHVIAGMIAMGIVALDALSGKNLHRVELVGIYWHFVDIVWIFLFPLLYIAK
jgi:heme/copper-type cytochrome/quinol oxidase subunit 3